MRRGPELWLLLAVALTLAAIGAVASTQVTWVAFTLGVTPDKQAATVYGDRVVCQQPIDVPVPFQTVAFLATGNEPAGPPLAVEVRSYPDGRRLGAGVVRDEYSDTSSLAARVGDVPAGGRVAVCFRALGEGGATDAREDDGARLRGGPAQAARSSAVFLDGRRRPDDLALAFVRDRPRTRLSVLPDMLERATLWRPGPASGTLLAVMLAGVALAVPLLLGRALRRAAED